MTKRIFKVLGIVLAGVLALAGVIVGVLAATGKFRSDPIYPARLIFEQDVLQIQYDENDSSKLYSFRLTAQSDKAKEVNQRTCYVYLDRQNQVNNENLIILTDSKGQSLTPEQDGFYKINCNQQTYFKVNSSAVEQTYSSNKADFGFVTISAQARRNGTVSVSSQNNLRIEIDIAANKLVLNTPNKDAELSSNGETQDVKIFAGTPQDLDFVVSPNNSLLPVVNKHTKEVELYYDNGEEGKYIRITKENCTNYDLQWIGDAGQLGSDGENRNIYHTGYRFLSNSNVNKKYNFVAVIYPTYLAKAADNTIWDENTADIVYDQHISKLPHLNISISVQFANIESINIGSSAQLDLNVKNEFSLNDFGINMTGAGSEDRYNEIIFKLSNFENAFLTNSNLVFGSQNGKDLYFNNLNSYTISNGLLTDTATNVQYTINYNNRLTLKNNTGVTYRLIDSITATDTTTNFTAKYGAIFVRTSGQNHSLVVLGSGSYMDFYKQEDGMLTTATDFVYSVEKATKNAGINNSWIITPNTENKEDYDLELFLFVVNSNGKVIMPNNACKVAVNPKYNLPSRVASNLTLSVGYNADGRIFDPTPIENLYNFNTENTSYNGFALVVLATDAKYFETISKISISDGNLTYKLVGYFDGDNFVNAVKATNEIINIGSTTPKLYPILLKTNDITNYINPNTTSVDFIKLGGNSVANETFSISANLSLNILDNDLNFDFVSDTYMNQNARGVEYMFFGDYKNAIEENHTLKITSNVNDLQITDLLTLFENDKDLIALLSSSTNILDGQNINVTNTVDGKNAITITFTDLVSSASQNNYYHFAVNIGGGRQIVCNTNVYFVPNTPNEIVLKLNGEEVTLAGPNEDFTNSPYLKVTIGWNDEQNEYTYTYQIVAGAKTYSIASINDLFNQTTTSENQNKFYATPYESLPRNLRYSTSSTDGGNYFTLNQADGVTAKVVGVTTETGYSIINITCDNITRCLKVEVVAEEGFSVNTDKSAFVENNELSLISDGYLTYKNGEQNVSIGDAIVTDLDGIISGVKNFEVEIVDRSKTLGEIGDGKVVAGIKVQDKYLLKIEYKDGDLLLTREKYLQTDLQFNLKLKLKTQADLVTISIKFSPSLSINESQDWNSFYAGTTVLLYKVYNDQNQMATDLNKPIYKILDKSEENIKVKYLHGDTIDGNHSSATEVNNGGELQLQAGKYKFFFFKGDADTPIELDYDYTFNVLENTVAVLKSNTINLKSASSTELSSLIDLYSYKTDDTVYGKSNNGSVKMYTDGNNLQKMESGDYSKLSIGDNQGDSDNLLSIAENKFVVNWVSELNYNKTFTINLQYDGNPIAIWLNGTDLTKQNSNDLSINITNAYKVEINAEEGLQTYLEYNFDNLFNVTTDNSNKTLKISSVSEQANNNQDVKFKMLNDSNKFYAFIENPSLESYQISATFTFIVEGVENQNTLTGTFVLIVKPYVPKKLQTSTDYYIESSYDIIKTTYSAQPSDVDFVTKITIVAIGEHTGYDFGYENKDGKWQPTTAGASLTLSRGIITLNGETATVMLTIQITYSKQDSNASFEYELPIVVNNNQAIKINYPIDTTTDEQLVAQVIDMTLETGGSYRETFDKFEVVPIMRRLVGEQTLTNTTIDLKNDSFLDLNRVLVWDSKNGYSPLDNSTIELYAHQIGDINYGLNNGITISGTQITFNMPANSALVDTMYFVFRIKYGGAPEQFYKIKAVIISDNDNLSQTYFKNNIDVGVVYSESNNQIVKVETDDIKLLGKSIKTSSQDNQLNGNIDGLFGNKSYNVSNLQFFLVNAKYLVDGKAENLVKLNDQAIAVGGLVNGRQAAILSSPTEHLTLRLMVVYSNADKNQFVPVGTITAYVSPTNNENGALDDLAKSVKGDIITGEYNVDLSSVGIGSFAIIDTDKRSSTSISSAEILTESVTSSFACTQADNKYTIKYKNADSNDANTTILTLSNGSIEISNFVEIDLKFTAIYTLDGGAKIKVNYTFGRVAPTQSSGDETLGDNYSKQDGKFNNYLTISNYIPKNYNGTLSFTINNQTSASVDYLGSDSALPTQLKQNGEGNIEIDGHIVSYGYKGGALVLYFEQTERSYNVKILLNIDNLAVKSTADAQANISVNVSPKLYVEFNNPADLSSPYELTNVKTDYTQKEGSSIYVDVTQDNDTTTFTIYDGDDSKSTALATIITTQNAQLQITFKNSEMITSELVQKLVLASDNAVSNGVATITKSTTINFAHLPESFKLVLDFVVASNGVQLNSSENYNYYIDVPQTYSLIPVYEVMGAEREIVAVNQKYYLNSGVNGNLSFFNKYEGESVNDIADKSTTILNTYKLAIQQPGGQTTFNYEVAAMGFLDDNSINKLTLSNPTGQMTLNQDDNGQYLLFNSPSSATITISNSVGVTIVYNFKIMSNGNGIDKASSGMDIFKTSGESSFNYLSMLVNDNTDEQFTLADDDDKYGKVVGQVRDGDANVFHITDLQVQTGKDGNLSQVSSNITRKTGKDDEINDENVIAQYQFTQGNLTFKITYTSGNLIYLDMQRTGGSKIDIVALQLTMYGNSKIETGFRIYIFNVKATASTDKLSDIYGYSENSINLSEVYNYTFNDGTKIDKLGYEIVDNGDSWARIKTDGGNGISYALTNVFNSTEIGSDNLLKLKTQVQDISVHLKLNVTYTFGNDDNATKIIIQQQTDCEFTIKRGVSLFFKQNGTYTELGTNNGLVANYEFLTSSPTLPYKWDITTPYTFGREQQNCQIVACRLDKSGDESVVTLKDYLNKIDLGNETDNKNITYSDGYIIFNKDINDSKEYNFTFTITASGTTYSQSLRIKFKGFVGIEYKTQTIISNGGNGYDAGTIVSPISPTGNTNDSTGIQLSLNATLNDNKQLALHYQYAIIPTSEWSLSSLDNLSYGEDFGNGQNLKISADSIPSITLPATSINNAVVVYKIWIEYIGFDNDETLKTDYYYVSYKLNGIDYINGFNMVDDKEYNSVDVDNNLISTKGAESKTILPLIYFKQQYTANEQVSRETKQVTFSLSYDSNTLKKQLEINGTKYLYDQSTSRWTNQSEDYYSVDFVAKTLSHFASDGAEAEKEYNLTDAQNIGLKQTKIVFSLKDNININDYFIFASELIGNNKSSLKFVGADNNKAGEQEGATQDLKDSYSIQPFVVEGEDSEVVLGVDLTTEKPIFNGRLSCKLVVELNGNPIQPANNTFSLYTQNEIVAKAKTLHKASEIFNTDKQLEILGIYNTSGSSSATDWVTANGGSVSNQYNDQVVETFEIGDTQYTIHTITYTLTNGQSNSLYTNTKTFNVIASTTDTILKLKQSSFNQQMTTEGDTITFNASSVFTEWKMTDGQLTSGDYSGEIKITADETNKISGENVTTDDNAKTIAVSVSALNTYFNENQGESSLDLKFKIAANGQTYDITIIYNKRS